MADAVVRATDLHLGYNGVTVLENINFTVEQGEIFGILGGSGCGKSTLLKHLIGLYRPVGGDIEIFGESIVEISESGKRELMRRFGVTYQGGALLGSLNLRENVSLPLEEFTEKSKVEIRAIAEAKLKLVGLEDYSEYMPAEISGGMMKRAGLARALALDPKLLFFDEPSAGLDPIMSAGLDRLIKSLRDDYGATIVIVTHELDSIFSIIDRAIILDKESRTCVDEGAPKILARESQSQFVRRFLSRDGMMEKASN